MNRVNFPDSNNSPSISVPFLGKVNLLLNIIIYKIPVIKFLLINSNFIMNRYKNKHCWAKK